MIESLSLFATSPDHAERMAAVDELHNVTAIYTAEHIVDELHDRLDWPRGDARLLDSSCGDGIFLGRALEKALNLRIYTDAQLIDLVQGWEIHPHACHQARARLAGLLIVHGRVPSVAHRMAEQMVHNRDFLTDAPTGPAFDVITGNFPYLRWLNVPQLLRDDYAAHVPDHATGDLLHSFLDRCARTLRPGGQIGIVSADRWLFAAGAAALREKIGENLRIQHLQRLDPKTAFYRPKQRRAGTPPRIHPIAIILGHAEGQALTREAIYPGADDTRYAGLPTLQELADVRLGPWLGKRGVFLVTGAQAAASGLPGEVLVPAVDAHDVKNGVLLDPTWYAIRTSPDAAPCGAVATHIKRQMAITGMRDQQANTLVSPETFHRLDLDRKSLMVPRIAKTPKGIRVPAGVLAHNHNLIVTCADQETLDKVERALASATAARWLSEHSAPLENGYYEITATLLRKVPMDLTT